MIKSPHGFLNTLLFEQNGPHFADNIFKCLFWIKMFVFSIKFHWSLIIGIQLAISQHWYFLALLQHHAINQWWFMIRYCQYYWSLIYSFWPLAFLMTPSDWTMSCHVLIMDDGRGWKHHRGTYKFLCRMDNFSGIYFNYIDINYIYINKKNWLFYMTQWNVSF